MHCLMEAQFVKSWPHLEDLKSSRHLKMNLVTEAFFLESVELVRIFFSAYKLNLSS